MDKIKLLIDLFVLIIFIDSINCDPHCDCSAMVDEHDFIKTKLHQIELDNFRIKRRLGRLEASKRHSTRPNDEITSKESDRQSTHYDKKEETHDNDRIDSMEAKLAGIESLLKINDVNGTDVQQGTIRLQVLDGLETKLASVLKQVNDTIAKNAVPDSVVRKTFLAEKRNRVNFEAAVKSSLEGMKTSFNEFKRESVEMITNHSETFDRRLEQSADFLNEELTDTKTGLSSLREVTINNKIEFNVAFTAYNLNNDQLPHSTMLFRSTYINNGNAYDTTTGKFTCKIPGVYYFSVKLNKRFKKLHYVSASLRINNVNTMVMYRLPLDDDKHWNEAIPLTQSGTFHMNKNDVVDIYGVPNFFDSSYTSIFTGYLITPD